LESLNHLFLKSESANQIWSFFENVLNINYNNSDIFSFLHAWMNAGNPKSQLGNTIWLLVRAIPWCLWTIRNNRKFGNKNPNVHTCTLNIYNILYSVCPLFNPSKGSNFMEKLSFSVLGMAPIKTIIKRGILVKWLPHPKVKIKLNTDGS